MASIPIYKGRKINKILSLICLSLAGVLLLAAGVCMLLHREALSYTCLIVALIFGGFGALYGILWFYFGRKERSRQRQIAEQRMDAHKAGADLVGPQSGCVAARISAGSNAKSASNIYREFIIPKDQLLELAGRRFKKIVRGLVIAGGVVFFLIYGILFFSTGFCGVKHLLIVLVFSYALTLPGCVIQGSIYYKYKCKLPERIALFSGGMSVEGQGADRHAHRTQESFAYQTTDRHIYHTHEIRKITVSSKKLMNANSPNVFRALKITHVNGEDTYLLDFRSNNGDSCKWEEYGSLVDALEQWANREQVLFMIDYMN